MAQQAVNSLKKKVFVVATAFSIVLSATVDGQVTSEKCVTPDSLEGECIEIRNCLYVLDRLKPPLTQDGIESLRRFQCGFQGNQPYVCCPIEKQTTTPSSGITEHHNAKLLPVDACGQGLDNAIVSEKTNLFKYPWLVLLRYKGAENGTKFRCGGVIINEKYILTAAHCITELPDDMELSAVRIGDHNLISDEDCDDNKECAPPAQDMETEQLIPHPEFDKKLIQNDIGLIRLAKAINISQENTQPICMSLDEKAENFTGRRLNIGGWGITRDGETSTDQLTASVSLVDPGACAETYSKFVNIYANKQLCTSPEYSSERRCVGDSGGPLMEIGQRSRSFVRGVMSFGVSVCRTSDYPRVYTRVDYYTKWILDTIKP